MASNLNSIKTLKNFAALERSELINRINNQSTEIAYHVLKIILLDGRSSDHWINEIKGFVSSFRIQLNKKSCLVKRDLVWKILYSSIFEDDKVLGIMIKDLEVNYKFKNFKPLEMIKIEAKKVYQRIMDFIYPE